VQKAEHKKVGKEQVERNGTLIGRPFYNFMELLEQFTNCKNKWKAVENFVFGGRRDWDNMIATIDFLVDQRYI
jgi:hypothetical protein